MKRSPAPVRYALLALVALATLLTPASLRAQPAVTLTAAPAFDGNYVPGAWLPVTLTLSNSGPPLQALVAATLPEAPFRNTQLVELPTGAEKSLVLYVAMEQSSRTLRLSVEDGATVLAEQELEVRPRPDERMLGLLAGQDPQLRLPRRQDLAALPFTVVGLTPAALPERAAGLSSLGLILLSAVPTDGLTPGQAGALLGWVSAGGHLFIGGGPAAAGTVAGLPAALQPATIGAPAQIDDSPLAAFADGSGPGALDGVTLAPTAGARAVGSAAAPAWVTRRLGQGAVTQLAFDPGLPALVAWPGAPQLWDGLLRSPTLISTPFGLQPRADVIQEQIIAGALTSLPAISLPPADLVFGILALYAVLVGPGAALLLRRYDRQALAWAVVPALSLLTAALVFGLAFALRADQRVINQLSLVEGLAGDQARARTYIAALSPQARSLEAELTAPALVRPVRGAGGPFGTVAGVKGDVAQESAALAMGLEAWQLQGLAAESQLPLEGITIELVAGPQGPRIALSNGSDQLLRDAVAVFGERVAFLGNLRPGERLEAGWPDQPLDEVERGTPISYLVLGDELDVGRQAGQSPDRGALAREALINAAVARGSAGFDEGPMVLAWMERSPLSFAINAEGAAREDTTLLVLRPVFSGSGPVRLPDGWLRPDLAALGRPTCNGDLGLGILAAPSPVEIVLRLPPGLAGLQAETVALTMLSSGRWPNAGVTTELFDWEQGAWVEQDFDGPGDLAVGAAAPYLRGGELRLRLAGPIEAAQCLYVSAEVQGVLP